MFTPFKNIKPQPEPIIENIEIAPDENDIYFKPDITSNQNATFEGVKVSDLQESGLNTIELLKSASKNMEKPKYNTKLLDTIYLPFIIEQMGGTLKKTNVYTVLGQEIAIKLDESKWFNVTKKKGSRNAITLVKHLLAIQENVDEFEEKNSLFLAACNKLTQIQEIANQQEDEHHNKTLLENTAILNKTIAIEQTKLSQEADKEINTTNEEPLETGSDTPPLNKNNDQTSESEKVEPVYTTIANSTSTQPTPQKPKIDWKARDEALNSIPLSILFEDLGANRNEDGQVGKWKIYDTGENVHLKGDFFWYSWNGQEGKYGAISYMKYHIAKLQNLNLKDNNDDYLAYRAAVKDLLDRFGSELGNFESTGTEPIEFKGLFYMPHVIDFKINQVKNYLHEKRGLPLWIINKQIQAGSLFAGFPSDWESPKTLFNPDRCRDEDIWATFLAVNGEAAEMRAIKRTDKHAKILAKGSSKDLGGFLLKAEKTYSERTVTALEASIDSCSYHAFYPGRVATSCMGVNFNLAVKAALEVVDKNISIKEHYPNPEKLFYKFHLAFDNDLAGNEAAVRFKERMIEEVGDEDYKNLIADNTLNYFDLGIRCLKESINNNETYYFDAFNNQIGIAAATMFQESLTKDIGMPAVKEYIKEGKLKYLNLWPNLSLMSDPKKEAETVYNLLCGKQHFYMRIKEEVSEEEEKKPELKIKKDLFLQTFNEIAQERMVSFKESGKIITEKLSGPKDWNEYLLYQKQKPEFKNYLDSVELEFGEKYNNQNTQTAIKKNKRKM